MDVCFSKRATKSAQFQAVDRVIDAWRGPCSVVDKIFYSALTFTKGNEKAIGSKAENIEK